MARLSRVAPEIPVSNLREAIEYYEGRLGFRIATETPAGDYAIVERDDIALQLFQDNARSHSPVAIHIFTHELEELHEELCSVALVFHNRSCRKREEIVISV